MKLKTRNLLIIFVFFFWLNVVSASDISQFVFTTDTQTIKPNEISEKITVQAQDADGNSFNIPQTGCVQLKTTSAAGEISSSNTNWNPVNILTMNKNTANRSFYYKDSTIGNYILTINIVLRPETETRPCASWPVEEWNIQWTATQNIIISEQQIEQPQPSSQPEPTTVVDWPVEPQIFANAGEDKTGVAGADIKFSGQALGLGKEPLENARYLWTFGDGAKAEGKTVLHAYQFPGNYIVFLNVSSGKFSASDRIDVKVGENNLKIVEANKDYVELRNGSNYELDISGWFLSSGAKFFRFPETTMVGKQSGLKISSLVSGISKESGDAVNLLYPNGSVADSCNKISPSTPLPQEEVAPMLSSKSTTVVDSGAKAKEEPIFVDVGTVGNLVSDSQVANVVATAKNNSWSVKKYLIIVLVIGIIAGAGLILIRRKTAV